VAAEARRRFNKFKGECGNMAKFLDASAAVRATKEANKLKGEYANMATCHHVSQKAAVQAT